MSKNQLAKQGASTHAPGLPETFNLAKDEGYGKEQDIKPLVT
jgi:hypothetical protein